MSACFMSFHRVAAPQGRVLVRVRQALRSLLALRALDLALRPVH
jgi:hypothetical protein